MRRASRPRPRFSKPQILGATIIGVLVAIGVYALLHSGESRTSENNNKSSAVDEEQRGDQNPVSPDTSAATKEVLDQVVKSHGIPLQQVKLSDQAIYYLYDDSLVKASFGKSNRVFTFKKLERNGQGKLTEDQLPNLEGWQAPADLIRSALLEGQLMNGMRIEEVVLLEGPPGRISERSGIGKYWQCWKWTNSLTGTLQFEHSRETKSLVLVGFEKAQPAVSPTDPAVTQSTASDTVKPDSAQSPGQDSIVTDKSFEAGEGSRITSDTLVGHTMWITSVRFTPDGKSLVSSAGDGLMIVWDVATGTAKRKLGEPGPENASWNSKTINGISISPNGEIVAAGLWDASIELWELGTGTRRLAWKAHESRVTEVVFSPDGGTLASASDDKTIKIWRAESGVELKAIRGHGKDVLALAFSPDGRLLASGSSDNTVKLWDTETWKEISSIPGPGMSVSSLDFSPDGKLLAVGPGIGSSNVIQIRNYEDGTLVAELKGHRHWVNSIDFSPDGRILASGSADNTIKLWDTARWSELKTLQGHGDTVEALSFSPDSKVLASGSSDNTVRLWHLIHANLPEGELPNAKPAGIQDSDFKQGESIYLSESARSYDSPSSQLSAGKWTPHVVGKKFLFKEYVQDNWIAVDDGSGKTIYFHPSTDFSTEFSGRLFRMEGVSGKQVEGYLVGGAFFDYSGADTNQLRFIDEALGEISVPTANISGIELLPGGIAVQARIYLYDDTVYSGKFIVPSSVAGLRKAYLVSNATMIALDEIRSDCVLRPKSHPADTVDNFDARRNAVSSQQSASPDNGIRCEQSIGLSTVPCELSVDSKGVQYQNKNMSKTQRIAWEEIETWEWQEPYTSLSIDQLQFRVNGKTEQEAVLKAFREHAAAKEKPKAP